MRITVLLHASLLLERSFRVPFGGRRKIALVMPEELAPVIPRPLEEYLYDFTVPSNTGHPVSVFLLPAEISREIAGALSGHAVHRLVPLDIAAGMLAPFRRAKAILMLARSDRDGRFAFFSGGRYVAGRNFRLAEAGDEAGLEREKKLFLHSVRGPDDVAVREFKESDEAALAGQPLPRFTFRAPGAVLSVRDLLFWPGVALALLLLAALVVASLRERDEMRARLESARAEVDRARRETRFDDERLLDILTAPAVTRLMNNDLSPLVSFERFAGAVPEELPLMLEYLEIDRNRLTVNARLRSPEQVDRLVSVLLEEGAFREPSLGELRVESDHVQFPLTLRVAGAEEGGAR